jgi:hypothetical protein
VIRDRALLSRFNPGGVLKPAQYLARLKGAWVWIEDRKAAFVWPSHKEACDAAEAHGFEDGDGRRRLPFALVMESPQGRQCEEVVPSTASAGSAERERAARPRRARRLRVAPEESFRELERRHLD